MNRFPFNGPDGPGSRGGPGFQGGPGRFGRALPALSLHHESTWLSVLHVLLPFLVLVALGGFMVWAVLWTTRNRQVVPASGWIAAPAGRPDLALDQVRMRYASGEIGREDFVRLSNDLGSPLMATEPVETQPPPTPPADPDPPAA